MKKLGILASMALSCVAQFAPLPQADSPEEFDSYLAVVDAGTPGKVIAAGDAFVRAWPASGLRGHVYKMEFEAYRRLGDADKAIEAAEKSLTAAPDNLVMLANLSVVLANGTRDAKRLAHAETYARKVIELSTSIRLPKFIRPDEWEHIDARLNSQAHAALGLVANQRGDIPSAIHEFEAAIKLAPEPDATQYYRLGLLYSVTGNISAAREKLRRAAELNEPAIRELAEQQLRQLPKH
jgi:tetratricopeptide (TPR) repeat protein